LLLRAASAERRLVAAESAQAPDAREDVRGHVERVRRVGRDVGVAARRGTPCGAIGGAS
jgi:hypothetical protein